MYMYPDKKTKPNEKNPNTFVLQKNWRIIAHSGEEVPSKFQIHQNAPNHPKKSKPHSCRMFFPRK